MNAAASPSRTRLVYLMGPVDGLWKIGFSACPVARAAAIGGTSTPVPIRTLIRSERATWLERYLHQAFNHRQHLGEWFRLTDAEVEIIAGMESASDELDIPSVVQELHKANARTAVGIGVKLAKRLRTIAALKNQMGQRFDADRFLDSLVRGPIEELYNTMVERLINESN